MTAGATPARWPWMVDWFRWYSCGYMAKHFHAVRLSRAGPAPPLAGGPAVVVLNHPSWWDPLVCCVLSRLRYPEHEPYAPIDAAALRQYPFLAKLGFFGVEPGVRGAATFLRTAEAVLRRPNAMLWVTGQGKFTDPRERPTVLEAGVAHLAKRMTAGALVPLAIEYPFWNERTPEALARFGEPLRVGEADAQRTAGGWNERLERGLEAAQDALGAEARSRDPDKFETLVAGRVGVGGVYDLWRRAKALATGRRFEAGHGRPPG